MKQDHKHIYTSLLVGFLASETLPNGHQETTLMKEELRGARAIFLLRNRSHENEVSPTINYNKTVTEVVFVKCFQIGFSSTIEAA